MNENAADSPRDEVPNARKLKALGLAIREQRKSKRLSLQEVSDKAGKSIATLSRIEAGRQSVDVGTLLAIADVLGCSAGALLVQIQAEQGHSKVEQTMWKSLRKIM